MAGGAWDGPVAPITAGKVCGNCRHWYELPRPTFGRSDVRAGGCEGFPVWFAMPDPSSVPNIYEDDQQAWKCGCFQWRVS
ncbi:hypothetical protein [Trinickia sp. EG282A]|uniref:hypothetical protein n=1 Tax=Trinickia sp. EG282A TaxID=3237013 RepID=UPI0034D23541